MGFCMRRYSARYCGPEPGCRLVERQASGECRNVVCMDSSGREVVYGWDRERRSRGTVGVGAGVRPRWTMTARSRGDMYSATGRPGNALPGVGTEQ
jgi:hypothetical protein